MSFITRRGFLAGATLAAGLGARKPRARAAQGLEGLHRLTPPAALPPIRFVDAAGRTHALTAYRGRGVVLNLWATWCAPCVAELPSLAALARAMAGTKIAVLALSSDRGGAPVVERFYAAHRITGLPVLLDPEGTVMGLLGARGIPTTYLITPDGKEAGWVEGAQDWAAPAAIARVKALIGG